MKRVVWHVMSIPKISTHGSSYDELKHKLRKRHEYILIIKAKSCDIHDIIKASFTGVHWGAIIVNKTKFIQYTPTIAIVHTSDTPTNADLQKQFVKEILPTRSSVEIDTPTSSERISQYTVCERNHPAGL